MVITFTEGIVTLFGATRVSLKPISLKMNPSEVDFVVNFVTKDPNYSIPSAPINVKGSFGSEELNNIVKTLIAEDENQFNFSDVEFDFLINEKLLRLSLQEFVASEKINPEVQLEIEYFVRNNPPKPRDSFLHDDWVSSIDTLDSWILSGCYDNSAHIWDVESGEHKIAIPAHKSAIKAVKWISSSQANYFFLTCSHDETAVLWKWNSETNSVNSIAFLLGHIRSVDCAAVAKDLIATGSYDHMLKIWPKTLDEDSESKLRSPVSTLEGHKEAITGCAWTLGQYPNIVTVSLDNTVRVWDIDVEKNILTMTSNKPLLDVAYSHRTELLLTASCDRHIRLWDQRSENQIKSVYSSHEAWVSSVCWSSTSHNLFISGSYDHTVKQWDVRSLRAPLYDLMGHQDRVMAVDWSSFDYIVSGGVDNHIKVYTTQ